MRVYEELVRRLIDTGIPFAEYEWASRPTGEFGVVSLDRENVRLCGSNMPCERAWEGSIQLYLHSAYNEQKRTAVEAILMDICGSAWQIDDIMYERTARLLHVSYTFRLEAI